MTEGNNSKPNPTQPEPTPTPPESPVERSEQDQQMANDITEAAQMVETAKSDTDIGPLLAKRGYDATELANGAARQAAAQTAFNHRQEAKGEFKLAVAAAAHAERTARQAYTDFREIARTLFEAEGDRAKLGLKGKVSKDLQKFVTSARAAYTAAQSEPYVTGLTKRGFKPQDMVDALKALDALEKLAGIQSQADGDAQQSTKDRNAAYEDLMGWVRKFRKVAKIVLRGEAALRKKLKL